MLKLSIDNIGIVKKSEIILNGITAITGHNNSGKTTVGKALYSIVSSVEDLSNSNLNDKNRATANFVSNLVAEIHLRSYGFKEERDNINQIVRTLYEDNLLEKGGDEKYLDCVQRNIHELFSDVINNSRKGKQQEFYIDFLRSTDRKFQEFRERLNHDFEPVNYVNIKLGKILFNEFNDQVLPVNSGLENGYIQLLEDEKKIFDVVVAEKGLKKRKETFSMSMFDKKSIFIDDVYVLDDLVTLIEKEENESKFFIQSSIIEEENIKTENHKQKLIDRLWQKDGKLYSDMLNKEKTEKIYNRLDGVFEDKVVLKSGRLICANSKVHIGNLAMGAKVFALLRMLLDNGTISKDTILILDEPEVHLHPEWQNVLAELLVLIMQEVGTTILLTTHSSQFLMALETYVKQYQKQENFKVYTTERLEDGHFVRYVDRTENIKEVYYKLAKPLFDIKAIKDSVEG